MKKGLRRVARIDILSVSAFESRPYEEGIKTLLSERSHFSLVCLNRDLMKKGLRLRYFCVADYIFRFESRPYEEGIKTVAPQQSRHWRFV